MTRRIAFCHFTSDTCGGSDRALFDLVAHLDRSRFTPFLLLKAGDPMAAEYRALGAEVAEIPFVSPRRALEWRKLMAFFLWFWPHTLRAARQFRRWNADLVHVNTSTNLQGAVAARLARRPLVWHVRELIPDSRSGALMRAMVPILATRAVAISSAVAASLERCGARLRTVPDGIDLARYLESERTGAVRAEFGVPDGAPLVVTVGRLEPWKGQDVLIEAAPALFAGMTEAHILIVGGAAVNKPEYAVALQNRCRELGLEGRVRFTGVRHDIPAILADADVLVLPSVRPEPFGLTVIEAMASARPVVATAAGGPLDTVVEGETGRLVKPGDPDALAAAVLSVLRDPAGAADLGEAGRRRAVARYGIGRLVADMAGVFEELTARGDRDADRPARVRDGV